MSEFLLALKHSPLTDIYIPGFIDDGSGSAVKKYLPPGACQFRPMFDDVYLELEDRLLHLHAPERNSRMSVKQVERIDCLFEIDPDDTFGVTSVFQLVRQGGHDTTRVLRLDVFLADGCDLGHCVFAALGLLLDGDDYIFLNPLNFDGIRIGSQKARDEWVALGSDEYSMMSYDLGRV